MFNFQAKYNSSVTWFKVFWSLCHTYGWVLAIDSLTNKNLEKISIKDCLVHHSEQYFIQRAEKIRTVQTSISNLIRVSLAPTFYLSKLVLEKKKNSVHSWQIFLFPTVHLPRSSAKMELRAKIFAKQCEGGSSTLSGHLGLCRHNGGLVNVSGSSL